MSDIIEQSKWDYKSGSLKNSLRSMSEVLSFGICREKMIILSQALHTSVIYIPRAQHNNTVILQFINASVPNLILKQFGSQTELFGRILLLFMSSASSDRHDHGHLLLNHGMN